MKQSILLVSFTTCTLLFLSGCGGRIVDWGKQNFYQGEEGPDYTDRIKDLVQSKTIYDQLSTAAMFDVLWLDDEVRTLYADMHSARLGKTPEQYKMFLRRQLEENNHFITFYVLSLYKVPLNGSDTPWSLQLQVGDNHYTPIEIKQIELNPEYVYIFGDKLTKFKTPYQVKFGARNADDQPILHEGIKDIALHVTTIDRGATFNWEVRRYNLKDTFDEE